MILEIDIPDNKLPRLLNAMKVILNNDNPDKEDVENRILQYLKDDVRMVEHRQAQENIIIDEF